MNINILLLLNSNLISTFMKCCQIGITTTNSSLTKELQQPREQLLQNQLNLIG